MASSSDKEALRVEVLLALKQDVSFCLPEFMFDT